MVDAELVGQLDAAGVEQQLDPSVYIFWLILEVTKNDLVERPVGLHLATGFQLE